MKVKSTVISQLVAAAVLNCGLCGMASAGVITSITMVSLPGASTGNVGPVGSTPSANNDNTASPSPNTVPYSFFLNAGGVGNADIEFVVANSGGTTEYRVNNSGFGVINNTGQAWQGFLFELGFGIGDSFVRSGALDGLDFDTPDRDPTPASTVFPNLGHQTDTLLWAGASVPSIGSVRFDFAIDVPDDLTSVNPNGVNRFTLRQRPLLTVPEPMTAVLLLAGLAGIAGVGRRRK